MAKASNSDSYYQGSQYKPVNPYNIPEGTPNNGRTEEIQFEIDLIDNYQARIFITDMKKEHNYTVPERAFKRPTFSFESRLSQLGFNYSLSPSFTFEFRDIYTNE